MPPVEEVLDDETVNQTQTAENEAAEEAAFLLAFQDGDGAEPMVTEEVATEEVPEETVTEEVAEEEEVPEELAQITSAQWQDVVSRVNGGDDLRASIRKTHDDAFGKIGGLERTIREIQAATPVGHPVVVSADDLSEFKVEFPDLAEKLAKDLTKVLGKFKGTGQSGISENDFEARVQGAVDQKLAEVRKAQKIEDSIEVLADAYEDWQTITGPKDSDTAYRRWLAKEPVNYQNRLMSSNNGLVIARSIDRFKEAEKTKAKRTQAATAARTQRLEEAVSTRGGAATAPGSHEQTEEEAFLEAFNS